jgi:hypothetical protein
MQQTCSKYEFWLVWDVARLWLSFTDVSGQNVGSLFKGQAFQLPRTCLCRNIIAKGKTTALDRG